MAEPLASHWESRGDEYDVVTVGSGYGGAITAARIAGADINPKPRVCILERGMEWIPGTFPDEPPDALAHFLSPFNPLGLYELSLQPAISVLLGSGLGGTSLVNANVAIIPEDAIFAYSLTRVNRQKLFYSKFPQLFLCFLMTPSSRLAKPFQGLDNVRFQTLTFGVHDA